MNCPSCGAEIPIDAQYARLVVCGHCKTSIIVDEKAARVAGKMAVLAQTPGPLFVGGAGKIRGKRFEVVGRVRYGYAKGFWDEWYLRFEDGKAAWISEDEYNFTLEVLRTDIQTPVDFAQAKPGDVAKVGDTTYHIDEKDVANCEGGEGQLPFSIAADQKVPFLEMSAGRRFCTLEYELDGGVRVFVGKRIKVGSIRMDVSAQEAGAVSGLAAERAATDGGRERIVRSGERSQEIKCFACAAPLGVPEVGADSMTCQYCSAELDLTLRRVDCAGCGATVPLHGGAAAKGAVCPHCRAILNVVTDQVSLLGSLLNARQPRVPFTLGQKCVFDEATYILVGHIHYVEQWEVPYHSDEFLLYNKKLGYRWLVMSDGHFSWSVELDERPLNFDPRTAVPKRTFTFNDRSWTVFEVARNKARVTWVNGELPWVAQVGDKNSFMDAIDPPYLLSAEWTEDEMEWYQAEYLPRASVAEAFGMEVDRLPRAIDIAPHQPYPASPFRKQGSLVMIVFALIMGTLAVLALMGDSTKVADFTVTPEQYAQEYLTQVVFHQRGGHAVRGEVLSRRGQFMGISGSGGCGCIVPGGVGLLRANVVLPRCRGR